jgi:hypothetical protein
VVRHSIILLAVLLSFSAVLLPSENVAISIPLPTPTPRQNTPPDVVAVTMDKSRIEQWCPVRPRDSGDQSESVRIKSEAVDPDGDVIAYVYEVTGGRVVGQGASIVWDLIDVRPGNYSITVRAEDGSLKKGTAMTKNIKVEPSPDCDLPIKCTCPKLSISVPPQPVRAGEVVTFTVTADDGKTSDYKFAWTISAGKIVGGQGTHQVKVKTTPAMAGTNLAVNVETADECRCGNPVAEIVQIVAAPNLFF